MKWNPTEDIAALVAVQDDQKRNGMAANVGVSCPTCKTDSMDYDQIDQLNLIVWCSACQSGLTMGDRAARVAAGKEPHPTAS